MRLNGLIERAGEIVRHAIPLLRNPVSYAPFVLRHESPLYTWGAYLITGKRRLNGCRFFEDDKVTKFVIQNPAEASVAAIDDLLSQLPMFASVGTEAAAHSPQQDTESGSEREPQNPGTAKSTRNKRSTERNEGREKLIAALTRHHQYSNGSLLNEEYIGNNRLAKLAGVSNSTASLFFNVRFGGHTKYKRMCNNPSTLIAAFKLLHQEILPLHLYGSKPPGEGASKDE